jgi:hypothetical protein
MWRIGGIVSVLLTSASRPPDWFPPRRSPPFHLTAAVLKALTDECLKATFFEHDLAQIRRYGQTKIQALGQQYPA